MLRIVATTDTYAIQEITALNAQEQKKNSDK